ncbi:MAG: flagellar hook-length control protein FliK [Treponema sp.]|nr:flagellar hook-length control protein FliK [Treponema sp.]
MSIQISAQARQTQAGGAEEKIAQKANKLGAFAKLLDSLVTKQPSGEAGKQTVSVKSKASSKITKNSREESQIPQVQQTEKKSKKKEIALLAVFTDRNVQIEAAGKKSLNTRTKRAVGKNAETLPVESEDVQPVTDKTAVKGTAKFSEVERAEKKPLKAEQTPQKDIVVREVIPILTSISSAASANESFAEFGEKAQPVKTDARLLRKIRDKFDVQDIRTEQRTAALEQTQTPNRSETALDMAIDLRSNTTEDAPIDHKPQTFADILTRQLDGGLSSEIVKQAAVVLKDGGQGVIRLSLKPETLGSVKIRLEMSENKVVGHIIVDSGDALRAFDKAVPSLEQAFRDSGFETATLNASLSNNGGRGENAFRRNGFEEKPFFSERFVAQTYDDVLSINGYAERRSESVDLLA